MWKKYKILLAWSGFEPMTSRSENANHYTIEASYKEGQIFHIESYNVLLFCEVKIEMHVTYNEWILVCLFRNYFTRLCLHSFMQYDAVIDQGSSQEPHGKAFKLS